jgi:two-component system sensor histidine kinase/response regulator
MAKPKILVVDDQPVNVQLLRRKLEREGMEVIPAARGLDALELAARHHPDLILLDVMMPDLNGFEVCHRLKQSVGTRSIPVIFITARTSKESKLEGLGVGAVDYITKPIDLDETLARVQTQLRFVAMNREVLSLQRRLAESRRAASIGAITQGISHNLNNLLGVVIGYVDLIKTYYDRPDQVQKNVQAVEDAIGRIVSILRQLSTVAGKSRFSVAPTNLPGLLEDAVARFRSEHNLEASVAIQNEAGDIELTTNEEVLEEAIAKLLINAWESYGETHSGPREIVLATARSNRHGEELVEIRVLDRGRGIDDTVRDHVFEPFTSTKQTVGVGMGLTVARHSVRGLGGNVELHDRPGGGTEALLTHPLHLSQDEPELG